MSFQSLSRTFLLLVLAAMLLATGCNIPTQPAAAPTTAPTAAAPTAAPTTAPTADEAVTQAPTETVTDYNVPFTDPETFKAWLLPALMARDTEKLVSLMNDEFMTCYWRADGSPSGPADALNVLYNSMNPDTHLEWVKDADLKALMGTDPFACGYNYPVIFEAALVSGFGQDGRDEYAFLIGREDDNSLRWTSWVYFKGGISGARLGGNQHYVNDTLGISFYVPKDYEIQLTEDGRVLIIAPGPSERPPFEERAAALIETKPANGRTVQEIADQVKVDVGGPGFNEIPTMMGLDKAPAIIFDQLPGQDPNRQVFVVYNDLLYHIDFAPNQPLLGADYWQMEDLYAMMINTFHFTN